MQQSKHFHQLKQYANTIDTKQALLEAWKKRCLMKEQKIKYQKKIFGSHFNYSKIGLNKQKKYQLQEQKNTQIERSNRILLEKIQRIAKRSMPKALRIRVPTQVEHEDISQYQQSYVPMNTRQHNRYLSNSTYSHQLLQKTKIDINEMRTLPQAKKQVFLVKQIDDESIQEVESILPRIEMKSQHRHHKIANKIEA